MGCYVKAGESACSSEVIPCTTNQDNLALHGTGTGYLCEQLFMANEEKELLNLHIALLENSLFSSHNTIKRYKRTFCPRTASPKRAAICRRLNIITD